MLKQAVTLKYMEEDMKNTIKWLALVSLLLVVVMSFALISCGGDNNTDTDTNQNTDTSADSNTDSNTDSSTDSSVVEKTYTITFKHADGTQDKVTVKAGETVTVPDAKQIDGYTVAWETTDFTNIAADMTVNAVKTAIEYTITYEVGDGINDPGNIKKYKISENDIILKPAAAGAGFDFEGWYSDENLTVRVEKIAAGTTGNITLYAKYQFERFDITYETNGGRNHKNNPDDFNKTESVTLLAPTRNGYEFKGWFTDREFAAGTEITSIAKGTEAPVTVFAKWDLVTYQVEYILNGLAEANPENPISYTIETAKDLAAPLNVKAGYTFVGWFTEGAYINEITSFDKTVNLPKLYAKFEVISYDIKYELGGGQNASTNPATYTVENVGDEAIILADPTLAGATFLGWYIGEDKVTEVPATVGGVTITAKWAAETYSIEYVLNQVGATNAAENKNTYSRDDDFQLAAPIKENVNFIGWYLEPEFTTKVEATNGLVGNVTLYAKWSSTLPLTKNDVTIVANGGNTAGNVNDFIMDGNYVGEGIYSGYSFTDWYNKASVNGNSLTITLNNPTDVVGIKFYAMGNWVNIEVKALDENGTELYSGSHTVNNTETFPEFIILSPSSGTVLTGVKTVTVTCKTDGKIFRIAEVVVEVKNPAYEAPAAEQTPAE